MLLCPFHVLSRSTSILPNTTLAGVVGLFAGVGGSLGKAFHSMAEVDVLTNIRTKLTRPKDFIIVSFHLSKEVKALT
jgi:hypothetical protein